MNENSEEMKTDDLIASLEDKGIKLWTDNGKLRYSAPQGVMNSNIVQLLKNNKDSLMENLSRAKDDLKIIHDEEKDMKGFLRVFRAHTLWEGQRTWSTAVLPAISTWSLNMTSWKEKRHKISGTESYLKTICSMRS